MRITVIYHGEPEGWWAESPDAPSFFAAGETREVVRDHARSALPRILGESLDYVEVDIPAAAVAFAAMPSHRWAGAESPISVVTEPATATCS